TARMEAEGGAFVLVSPTEEKSLARIERQIGQRLPRVTLPDFDYSPTPPRRTGRAGKAGARSPRRQASEAAPGASGLRRAQGKGARPSRPRLTGADFAPPPRCGWNRQSRRESPGQARRTSPE